MRRVATVIAGLLFALRGGGVEAAPKKQDVTPSSALAGSIRIGRVVEVPGAVVVLLRADADDQSGLSAHVGLRGRAARILELPPPAGEMHVRISNDEERPIELMAGEALLTPTGPSRALERTVWLPPHEAAFVPVVHAGDLPPPGPYVSRGLGLTPFEQAALAGGEWSTRVRARNRRFGVAPARVDDAAAAYATDAFAQAAKPHAALDGLADGVTAVGVAVADARGVWFVHVEGDAKRFAEAWSGLRAGIVMDAILAADEGRRPAKVAVGAVRREVETLLRVPAGAAGEERPTFGAGQERRWTLPDGTGSWRAVEVDGAVVVLTLQRQPRAPAGAPPSTPPPAGGGSEPTPTPPGGTIADPRPTPFEERMGERRSGLPGGR